MIDNLFDVTTDNVHMVQVDEFEAIQPQRDKIRHGQFATEKQLSFLKRLFAERTGNEEAMILRTHLLSEYKAGRLSVKMASQAIEDILAMQKDSQPVTQNLEHGQVWVNSYNKFIKVCLNQQGTSFYGKFWDATKMEWIYGPGALRDLDHLITAEEAKDFSLQWDAEQRYCVFCMKHLSDPRSEFAGYGETCARNHNLPWGEIADIAPLPATEPYRPAPIVHVDYEAIHDDLISASTNEDVIERPYGDSTCLICHQPRPFILNGYLRGCNC